MAPPDSFKKFPFFCVCCKHLFIDKMILSQNTLVPQLFFFANFNFFYSIKKLMILKINILKINFKFLKNIIF
jgi:hypothetical protein